MRCCYSERLIDKLLKLNEKASNKVNITAIKRAIHFAKKYHGSQMRQSGDPYYSHPIEVAYMVADYLFSTDMIIVSLLHDTIEDTSLTKDMIAEVFDEQIASHVMDLTRIKEDGYKISSAEMVKSLFNQKKYEVLIIKLFDRLHNMQTIGAKSPEKVKKIVDETIQSFITLSMYLGSRMPKMLQIEEEIYNLCYQNLIKM